MKTKDIKRCPKNQLISGIFTSKTKKLVNVAIRPQPSEGITDIYGLFDLDPPTNKLRFMVLATAKTIKQAIEKARKGKYRQFISDYEGTHKALELLQPKYELSLSGNGDNYIILYNKKYFYYGMVPLIGLITTTDKRAAQIFNTKGSAENKISNLPTQHRRKSEAIPA